ncbi:LOW QUALITY PROTEIN: hypothetical protein NC651_027032 [Populus alba x Populus x berolinensis]|nr:LOW QUALITY PROTEIN: hypothetical protein NC651_027032 [Populus alba x Populus x berolinensis]
MFASLLLLACCLWLESLCLGLLLCGLCRPVFPADAVIVLPISVLMFSIAGLHLLPAAMLDGAFDGKPVPWMPPLWYKQHLLYSSSKSSVQYRAPATSFQLHISSEQQHLRPTAPPPPSYAPTPSALPSTAATVISPSTAAMMIQFPASLLSLLAVARCSSSQSSKQPTILFLQLNIQQRTTASPSQPCHRDIITPAPSFSSLMAF